jgi:glycosyltransferase involved in cell wall biosynthesis
MSNELVSVGMPVRNCESTLDRAIKSILSQSHEKLELIISDNASTDKTREICERYQMLDSRIVYIRHDINIGPTKNFAYTLKESKGKYFTWAAGDDAKELNFLKVNLDILENNQNAVASMGAIRFEKDQVLGDLICVGEFNGSPIAKLRKYFEICNYSQGLIYSLMRREEINRCDFIEELFFGWDWAINLFLLERGDILFSNITSTTFSTGGISNSTDVYKFHGVTGIRRVLPFSRFNNKVWRLTSGWSFFDRFAVMRKLVLLNLKSLFLEIRAIYPFLGKIKRTLKRFFS